MTDLQSIDILDRCCAYVCVCVWGQEYAGRRLADKTKLEWNTESGVWIIDRLLHVNAYTHAVKCKVQKHHSEVFWRPHEVLISLWSLLISLLVCFTPDAITSASPLPFSTFHLVFHSFLYLFLPPLYHSNPQRWHQTAAPSVNKCRCVCASILYPVKERECVRCVCAFV